MRLPAFSGTLIVDPKISASLIERYGEDETQRLLENAQSAVDTRLDPYPDISVKLNLGKQLYPDPGRTLDEPLYVDYDRAQITVGELSPHVKPKTVEVRRHFWQTWDRFLDRAIKKAEKMAQKLP